METLTGKTLLNRYFLRELVGSGGMADVYLAWDKKRSARMAIKIMRKDLGENPRFFQQFAREAETLNKLEHPSIVRLYEFDKDGEVVFIVMDWVEGSNLRQVIQTSNNPLPLKDVSRVLESISAALHYAHTNHIYHCDIKPANIMLQVDGKVLLADFGVAHLAGDNTGGGTPPYMAPEQFNGEAVDARTDIYALGITLYEALSGGQTPYKGTSTNSAGRTTRERIEWEHLHMPPPPLTSFNPHLPAQVEQVVTRAMAKKPYQRYGSVIDLRNAFEQARQGMREPPAGKTASLFDTLASLTSATSSRALDSATQYIKKLPQQVQNATTARQSTSHTSTPGFGRRSTSAGPQMVFRSGEKASQNLLIPMGETVIGRGSQSQIKFSDASVSRRHATIIRTRRGVYIRDDGSTLGTYVNQVRIFNPVLLQDQDVIRVGYQVLEYRKS